MLTVFLFKAKSSVNHVSDFSQRGPLMALTQDLCFYLFWLILSISARPNNDTPAACDVDTAKPAFDFLSKWVKRQHTGWGRRGREEEGLKGRLMELETRRRKLRGNWGFYCWNLISALCGSSWSRPLLSRGAGGHVDGAVVHEATQAAAMQLFKTPEFSLIHLQTDDTPVNKAGGREMRSFKPFKACNTRSSREDTVNCICGVPLNRP